MDPSAISGDALTIQTSATARLGGQLVQGLLEWADTEAREGSDKFRAGKAGDFGGTPLAHELHLVPFHGCGKPHLTGEMSRILSERGERAFRNLDNDLDHGFTVAPRGVTRRESAEFR